MSLDMEKNVNFNITYVFSLKNTFDLNSQNGFWVTNFGIV
jgi:hypothetical protein